MYKRQIYLRPETAQGIFVNFANIQRTTRKKIPFGVAQVGKAFRNEITPGNFTFRMREFEQMELELSLIHIWLLLYSMKVKSSLPISLEKGE